MSTHDLVWKSVTSLNFEDVHIWGIEDGNDLDRLAGLIAKRDRQVTGLLSAACGLAETEREIDAIFKTLGIKKTPFATKPAHQEQEAGHE